MNNAGKINDLAQLDQIINVKTLEGGKTASDNSFDTQRVLQMILKEGRKRQELQLEILKELKGINQRLDNAVNAIVAEENDESENIEENDEKLSKRQVGRGKMVAEILLDGNTHTNFSIRQECAKRGLDITIGSASNALANSVLKGLSIRLAHNVYGSVNFFNPDGSRKIVEGELV